MVVTVKMFNNTLKLGNLKKRSHLIFFIAISAIAINLIPSFVAAVEIVAIQSLNIKPYNEALKGFKNACRCDVKQIVISEMTGDDLAEIVNETKPDLILSIGTKALKRIQTIKDIPIVYVMVLNPQSLISDSKNITGIGMRIPPEKQLSIMQKSLPDLKSVGIIYDPKNTAGFVKKAKVAANSAGIQLISEEVQKPKDVLAKLQSMKGKIDAFWMVPDLTVITSETVESLSLFSMENNMPLIAFSKKYLEMGALMSLEIDTHNMGRQAWEIAEKVLSGKEIKSIKNSFAKKVNISVNWKVAEKIRIAIDKIKLYLLLGEIDSKAFVQQSVT